MMYKLYFPSSPVVPLYEVDAKICVSLLFQDKNEISPWEVEPPPCIKISQNDYMSRKIYNSMAKI